MSKKTEAPPSDRQDDPDKLPKAIDIPADDNQIAHWFTYHKPDEEAQFNHERVRLAGRGLATVIKAATRNCPDQKNAIDSVRQAVMWANAAIACKGK